MRLRAHHGLFLGFVAVVGILVAASVVIIGTGLRRQLVESYQNDLARDLGLAQLLLEEGAGSFANLHELADRMRDRIDYRVTVVAPDGTVLADSDSDYRTMENHGDRPEVQGALAGSTTFAERRSATVGAALLYAATELTFDGEPVVLRLAAPLENIDAAVGQTQGAIAGAGAVAIVLALGLSYVLARALAHPPRARGGGRRAALIAAGRSVRRAMAALSSRPGTDRNCAENCSGGLQPPHLGPGRAHPRARGRARRGTRRAQRHQRRRGRPHRRCPFGAHQRGRDADPRCGAGSSIDACEPVRALGRAQGRHGGGSLPGSGRARSSPGREPLPGVGPAAGGGRRRHHLRRRE